LETVIPYDELELERLYQRLLHQQGNAFFCVTVNRVRSHAEIAERIRERFPLHEVQIINFMGKRNFRFSSAFLSSLIEEDARIVFLANFHLAGGDMPDDEFFQVLNLSRDVLAEWPVVLVFMMPMYFRIQLAQNTPDFNSFFQYRADFVIEEQDTHEPKLDTTDRYSETNRELLQYYEEKYNTLTNHESKQAFETLLNILKLNGSVRTLSSIELKRFYAAFCRLLPFYQNESSVSANDIATVYDDQGDYAQALEWYEKDLAICEKVLGKEHPNTAVTYNNIALVYTHQGDYAQALEWYEKALAIREKVLGKEHPSTATTYNNIALVYTHQGDYAQALEWYEKALAIDEKVLGKEHPDTATTYNNIAGVYDCQGDYAQALEWHEKALAIQETVLGKEHPNTAATYNNTAGVYRNQGDYKNALELYLKAYRICLRKLGDVHPNTNTTKNNMEIAYRDADMSEPFEQWFEKNFGDGTANYKLRGSL